MNILILSNKDIASNFALNLLLPKLSNNHTLHLWLSAKVGQTKKATVKDKPSLLKELSFFEQELFNQVITPLLTHATTNRFCAFQGFEPMLASTLREENNINGADSLAAIKEIAPDLIISIRFGGILKEACIGIPKKGVINLHSGILPHYRGVMATFWAMNNGDEKIGTTLHTIDDSTIDTGRILKVSKQKVDKQKSYLLNVLALYKQGVKDILGAVANIAQNIEPASYPQPSQGDYYSFPDEAVLSTFVEKGYSLIKRQEFIEFMSQYYLGSDDSHSALS